jgi:hypothetical protein
MAAFGSGAMGLFISSGAKRLFWHPSIHYFALRGLCGKENHITTAHRPSRYSSRFDFHCFLDTPLNIQVVPPPRGINVDRPQTTTSMTCLRTPSGWNMQPYITKIEERMKRMRSERAKDAFLPDTRKPSKFNRKIHFFRERPRRGSEETTGSP